MKKGINLLKAVILVLVVIIGGTACMANPEESSLGSTSGSQPHTSSPARTADSATYSDKQIVVAVYTDYYGFTEEDNIYYANQAINRAEELPDRYLGSIISEEDAIEKAEVVWNKIGGRMLENLKNEHGNEKHPFIEATFYDKYDVWFVRTRTSGITEDGVSYGLTGGFKIVMRKSDGKVLAV